MRTLRHFLGAVLELLVSAAVLGLPGAWIVRHMDLAPFAAARASAALGRTVTVGHLRLGWVGGPGRAVALELADVSVANVPGGSAPEMATLRRLTATVEATSVPAGPLRVLDASIDGAIVLLERGPDGIPNWRRGDRAPSDDPTGRSAFPSLRHVAVSDSRLTYRTRGGKALVTRFDTALLETADDAAPAHLAIAGSYNAVKLTLDADLQSTLAMRQAGTPFGTVLRFASGSLRLVFDGTMADPLAIDRAEGTLDLDAPDPAPLFAIAGSDPAFDAPVRLHGHLEHRGPLWHLTKAEGTLGADALSALDLALEEGTAGGPDRVTLDLTAASLNLNELLGSGAKGKRSGADVPLTVERMPGTLLEARLSVRELRYDAVVAQDVRIEGAIEPARIVLSVVSLTSLGAKLRASGHVEADAGGSRIVAEVEAAGADVQTLRRVLGFSSLPLTGRLDGQVAVESSARTLNAAIHGARVSAIVAMRGGAVQKSLVEKASLDLRSLFRSSSGTTPVLCLLAGVDQRGPAGTVAPLRLRAAEGTLSGSAKYDLDRRVLDLTIGSEAKTTGVFALDIPIRVSGPFASPDVRPAEWSKGGRAALAAADDFSRLPPALQAFARRHPCGPG